MWAKMRQLRGLSDAARRNVTAKFVAACMGVCIFLTVSRVPRVLSKRSLLELNENEIGRTASEILRRGFIVEELTVAKTWLRS